MSASFGTVVATSAVGSTSPAATLVNTSAGALNVLWVSANSTGSGVQPNILAPAGWTLIPDSRSSSGTTPMHEVAGFYRVRQSGDSTTQAVSIGAAGGGNIAVAPMAFPPGEIDTTTPIVPGEADGASSAGPTTIATAAVTLAAARYVFSVFGNRSGALWSAATDANIHDSIQMQGRQSTSSVSIAVCGSNVTTTSGGARSLVSSASTSVHNTAIVAFSPAPARVVIRPPAGTATAEGHAPAIIVTTVVSGGGPGTATAEGHAPTVTGDPPAPPLMYLSSSRAPRRDRSGMSLEWVAVDLRTGVMLAEMPDLIVDWPLRHTIAAADSMQAHLPVKTAPDNWGRATMAGGAALIALDMDVDDPRGVPIGGGYITYRERLGTSAVVDLSLATIEGYLSRRGVGTVTYRGTPQNLIAKDLIDRFVVDGAGGRPGIPIRTVILPTPPGYVGNSLRDRSYKDADDAKVLTRLQQLHTITSGLEFTCEWEWRTEFTPARLCPVIYIGDRIGAPVLPGMQPSAMFEMPGSATDFRLIEDYSDGKGANDILAWSSGQGEARPQSQRQVARDFRGRPTFEARWSPSSSISDVETLDAHARRALQIVNDGSSALTITAAAATAPRLGSDWRLGDDIGYDLGGPDADGNETAPNFPGGLRGVNRCIATERTATTVTPILAVAEIPTEDDGL